MRGGNDKILDIYDNDLKMSYDVQQNIAYISKEFGDKFYIKINELIIPVTLIKVKIDATDIEYYEMNYFENKKTKMHMPFSIVFVDKNFKRGNNTCINFIRGTKKISGTNMIKICLEIQKFLHVKKTTLHDAASIKCDDKKLKLSFFKIIEKGKTYYQT